jgi:hypothetical protein
MYKIIGNDGKTYGPAGAEKIRDWIAQGRADARTAVIADGAADWTFLGLLPEFARELGDAPPVLTPPRIGAPPAKNANNFATAGFVCGLISLICCCGCPFNVLGLIFSIVALVQINGQTEKQEGWGLALAGLICSAVSLLATFGLGILQLVLHPANLSWRFGAI